MNGPESGAVPHAVAERPPAVSRRQLDLVQRAAPPAGVGVLVVICDDRPVVVGRAVQGRYPAAHLTVLSEGRRPEVEGISFGLARFDSDRDVLRTLAALPPADLVVDLRHGRPGAVRSTFHQAFLTLADGGRYVARQEPATPAARQEPATPVGRQEPATPVGRQEPAAPVGGQAASDGRAGRDDRAGRNGRAGDIIDDLRELARRNALPVAERRTLSTPLQRGIGRALGGVAIDAEFVVVRKSGEHILKLGVDETRAALTARGVEQRVIARVAPEVRMSASSIWSSDAALGAERLSDTIEVGELVCTVYEGAICAPLQVAVVERLLLPTSYYLPQRPAHRTFGMRYYGSDFSAYRQEGAAAQDLPGTSFHLDNQVPGHYGHVITHDLSKLWAWDAALAEYPELKVLISPAVATGEVPASTYELLHAFGIGPERVQVITGPVRPERLITATQAFQQPTFLSPVARDVWARVVAGLLPLAGRESLPEKVFVSRRSGTRRRCLNGDQVERWFTQAGFTVIYPEDLRVADQARLFSSAQVIAGYAGSGMINGVFSSGPATRIVLASKSYWATNEYHIAALYGGDLHYFWCDPVQDDGTLCRSPIRGDLHSDYVFDVERDGPALRALLGDLAHR